MHFKDPRQKHQFRKKSGSNLCDSKAHAYQLVYIKGFHTC